MSQTSLNGHIAAEDVVIMYGGVTAVRGISLSIAAGQQLTLLGPSGCGKTTMLRAIAGLQQPTSGEIRIGDTTVYSSKRGISIPAENRGLSMVFQSYAIWPHMTVFENVAYGLRVRKRPAAEISDAVAKALDLVQMGKYADRKASALSGGQQQRVALARAFVFQPKVLLFDEPLSNLDAKLRGDMRIELRELQHRLGITSLYVTHDLEEALAMSDKIVVMRDGRIEQQGTPDEIYNRPRSAFVADFVGSSNLVRGRSRPDLAGAGEAILETGDGLIMRGTSCGRPQGPDLTMSLRTVHLKLTPDRPAGEVNVWPTLVSKVVFQGDFTQAIVKLGEQTLVVRATNLEALREGGQAYLSAEPRHCVLLEE